MLFRTEAVRHNSRTVGDMLLVRPVSFALLTWLFSAMILGIVLFLCLFHYTKKIEVSGILLPIQGLTHIVARQSGIIAKRLVTEGDKVQAGDVLFIIENKNATATERDLESKIFNLVSERRKSYQAEQTQIRQQAVARSKALEAKLSDLRATISNIGEQVALQSRRTKLSEEMLETITQTQLKNYVTKPEIQQREAAMLEQQLQLAELKRLKLSAQQELRTVALELQNHKIQASRDEEGVSRDLSAVEQQLAESEARREIYVVAPHAGTASAINVATGQAVDAGDPLMAVVPEDATLEAQMYAPSRAIGFLRIGTDVRLRYQAFPYQKFGFSTGSIQEVATSAMRPEEINPLFQATAFSSRAEPMYRIRVRIDKQSIQVDGEDRPLRPGSLVDASVLIERRRLIAWMFEPILSRTEK